MHDEFVCAVMKTPNGEYVVVDSMPEVFDERETPYSTGEIEYILNRIVFDMHNARMVDEIANRLSPKEVQVSQLVQNALKRRKGL